ncbi:hypothetical protein RIR_jg20058.t1 [Rhizophagus irregularis DAOM 181602=DAOM 197198]|nr:hypothetical protein RIR_jg20058.t1 [Rhizophagus irregularis DAOM 181602=DAOM 197198]
MVKFNFPNIKMSSSNCLLSFKIIEFQVSEIITGNLYLLNSFSIQTIKIYGLSSKVLSDLKLTSGRAKCF